MPWLPYQGMDGCWVCIKWNVLPFGDKSARRTKSYTFLHASDLL